MKNVLTPPPTPITRRTALAAVLATGAGVAVGQQTDDSGPDGATPGHEFVGRVTGVGVNVTKFKAGDAAAVAPLLCAGMTVYSPLVHWKAGPGTKVAVVGMGGLGHMAVKLASAMGARVTVVSTTPQKEKDAVAFGAKAFVLSTDTPAMKAIELTQDLVINTIPYAYDPNTYLKTLARDGTMVNVGVIGPLAVPPDTSLMVMHRRGLAASVIGNPDLYPKFLAYCGEKNISATIEKIRVEDVNDAFPKVVGKMARYRYVLDLTRSMNA